MSLDNMWLKFNRFGSNPPEPGGLVAYEWIKGNYRVGFLDGDRTDGDRPVWYVIFVGDSRELAFPYKFRSAVKARNYLDKQLRAANNEPAPAPPPDQSDIDETCVILNMKGQRV